jgi:hypothetical protein
MRQGVAGQFDRFGYAPIVLRRGSLSGSLQLEGEQDRISGVIAESTDSAAKFVLYRNGASPSVAAFAGNYRMMFGGVAFTNGQILPSGSATLSVSTTGAVRLRGRLGDGSTVTTQGRLTTDGRLPLSVPLYRGRGSIIGWVEFSSEGSISGTARWMRPGDSRSVDFPDGFAAEVPVTGERANP